MGLCDCEGGPCDLSFLCFCCWSEWDLSTLLVWYLLHHYIDFSGRRWLEVIAFYVAFRLNDLFWRLVVVLVYKAIRTPSYLRYRLRRFRKLSTFTSLRWGWRSLPNFANDRTPLLSGPECNHDCRTTSRLCQECFQVVEKSGLLCGTISRVTSRVEWHRWDIPVLGHSEPSRDSCHLCNILWFSLEEQTRLTITGSCPLRQEDLWTAPIPWVWLSIWGTENDHWTATGHIYMSLFDNETPRHNLRKTIEVREGLPKAS